MAFNNGFPVSYQPAQIYYPQYQQPVAQPNVQPQASGFIWVNNEAEANNYLVAPNNAVALWDRNQHIIYCKSADASGMVSMRKLHYEIEGENAQQTKEVKYATAADLQALAERITKLEKGEQPV